jgi:hypothetical protein
MHDQHHRQAPNAYKEARQIAMRTLRIIRSPKICRFCRRAGTYVGEGHDRSPGHPTPVKIDGGDYGSSDAHICADRYLFSSRIDWEGLGGYYPLIGNGQAG